MFGRFFHRKSPGSPQVAHSVKAALDIVTQLTDEIATLRHRVHRLEIASKEQSDAHEQLYQRVHKLTGQFFGSQRGRQRSTLDSIPPGDKESLRSYAGLTPGRRPNHEE